MSGKTRVMVTGVGGRSVGNQVLHGLSLLGDKYHVVATDSDSFSFGLFETPNRYLVPPAADPAYTPAIERLIERERLNAILPGTEVENLMLAETRDVFASMGCAVIGSPVETIRLCSDKAALQSWLDSNGFHAPRSASATDWRGLVAEVGFPIVVKPTQDTGGSRGVAILTDEDELETYLDSTSRPGNVLFQEYIGTPNDEYTVGVLISRAGDVIDSIVLHRKLIGLSLGSTRVVGDTRYELSTGYSQGVVIRHRQIQDCCERLACEIGVRGPANIQCRLVQGNVAVFEVHARFSGTSSIRADVGFNEPDILLRNFLGGEKFGRIGYRSNVAAVRAFRSIIVPSEILNSVPTA